MPTPIGLLLLVQRHLTPTVKSSNDDWPQLRLRNGIPGRYDGAIVKTDGPSPTGAPATFRSVTVWSTIPGRIPPTGEPMPGNSEAELPPFPVGFPMVALVPTGKPKGGPEKNGGFNPNVPELPPLNG